MLVTLHGVVCLWLNKALCGLLLLLKMPLPTATSCLHGGAVSSLRLQSEQTADGHFGLRSPGGGVSHMVVQLGVVHPQRLALPWCTVL